MDVRSALLFHVKKGGRVDLANVIKWTRSVAEKKNGSNLWTTQQPSIHRRMADNYNDSLAIFHNCFYHNLFYTKRDLMKVLWATFL